MDWAAAARTLAIAAVAAVGLGGIVFVPAVRHGIRRMAARLGALPKARALLLVAVVAFLPRAALIPAYEPSNSVDAREYVEKAALIADEGHPRSQEFRPGGFHFYRTLGYSLALAGWYRVTGTRSFVSARWFNALLAAFVAVGIALLGAAAGIERAGRVGALAYGLYLPHVFFSQVPYTETWATLCVVAGALAFEKLRGDRRGGRTRLALAAGLGLAFGLLCITRTEFLWVPPLAVGLLLLEHRERWRRWVPAVVVVLAASAAPFLVNHTMRSGYPGLLRTSSQGGLILYFGNNPIAVNGHGNATPTVAKKVWGLYAEDRSGALARDEALAWMKANPGQVLRNTPKKAYHLWLASPQGFGWLAKRGDHAPRGLPPQLAGAFRWAAHAQSLAVLGVGLLGLLAWRPAYRLWVLVLAAHLAMWCLLAASPRNRYPLEPFLLLAAAALVVSRASDTRAQAAAHHH